MVSLKQRERALGGQNRPPLAWSWGWDGEDNCEKAWWGRGHIYDGWDTLLLGASKQQGTTNQCLEVWYTDPFHSALPPTPQPRPPSIFANRIQQPIFTLHARKRQKSR
jgi:hypothetical protein